MSIDKPKINQSELENIYEIIQDAQEEKEKTEEKTEETVLTEQEQEFDTELHAEYNTNEEPEHAS